MTGDRDYAPDPRSVLLLGATAYHVTASLCLRNAVLSPGGQPTFDVIRRLAVALQVSADVLIFGADERGPDGDLRLQF